MRVQFTGEVWKALMPKRKNEAVPNPSEETLNLLEPVRGIADVNDPQVAQTASQLLSLPQVEQVAAAVWMGNQPEYAGMLAYLVGKASVTGALRRAVKQSLFELRRRGVQVSLPAEEKPPLQEAASVSQAWTVEECFAAAPYLRQDSISALHLRFFMRHVSGQQAVFSLNVTPAGHLSSARLLEGKVRDWYEECLRSPYRLEDEREAASDGNEFVSVPVEWAVWLANECRQRNFQEHVPMPAHAAFYWGRLPALPEQPVAHPVDSLPDVEAGWLVTSLVQTEPPFPLSFHAVRMLLPYTPHPEQFAAEFKVAWEESQTRIVLSPQSEEERKQRLREKLFQRLFPDERIREHLLFMLPILGSIALLGGDRHAALWFKALWRELKERPDRPFWRTETAVILTGTSYHTLMAAVGMEKPQEDGEDAPQSSSE